MSLTNLITNAEATAAIPGFAAIAVGLQTQLLGDVSAAVNQITDRVLGTASYDEVFHPGREHKLYTAQWPITATARCAADLLTVLTVKHTDASILRATVSYTTTGTAGQEVFTGISLNAAGSGAVPLLFSTYTNLTLLAAAINAVSGWTATVTGGYGNWLTADLNVAIGSEDAKQRTCELTSFIRDLSHVPRTGSRVVDLYESFPDNYRFPDRMHGAGWGFQTPGTGSGSASPRYGGVRLQYTAGYATADVPSDIKRACFILLQALNQRADVGIKDFEGGQGYQYRTIAAVAMASLVTDLLSQHMRKAII